MKKIFTLIAAAFVAASVNAQELSQLDVLVSAGEADIPSGSALSNSAISVQFGGTLAGEKAFTKPVENGSCSSIGSTGYTAGNGNNPKDATVEGVEAVNTGVAYNPATGNLPKTGTFYIVTPAFNGTMEVGVVLNVDKTIYIVDAANPTAPIFTETATAKYYGTYSFSVTVGHKYYVFCNGSKLGFYGAQLTYKAGDNVDAVDGVEAVGEAAKAKAFKVAKNGSIIVVNGDAEYTVAGSQLK